MVIWSGWLNAIASAFDTTATEAGIIVSLLFTLASIFTVLIGTKGKKPEVTVTFTGFFVTILFTFMGWYPLWMGSVIALVVSILLARIISGGV